MKILSFSDLHLEFRPGGITGLGGLDGDVLVLAGDIVNLLDMRSLDQLLKEWRKPVVYVIGNHELYTRRPMHWEIDRAEKWLGVNHPHVRLLTDDACEIDGVHFFGGTMWTNFANANPADMNYAHQSINDFRLIHTPDDSKLDPGYWLYLHYAFSLKLDMWLRKRRVRSSPRVVISHHAPVIRPSSKFFGSALEPAFNSLDMVPIIETFQPDLWIYGHTHECDDQMIGKTRILSNQLGYPQEDVPGFDPKGKPFIL